MLLKRMMLMILILQMFILIKSALVVRSVPVVETTTKTKSGSVRTAARTLRFTSVEFVKRRKSRDTVLVVKIAG
jgi:hypothetical protein